MLMQHFLVLTLAFGPAGHHYCGLRRLGGLSHVFWQVVCLILSNFGPFGGFSSSARGMVLTLVPLLCDLRDLAFDRNGVF